ncbi:hypothetical protein Anacy_1809 [Anabaena cylindrica PCC 7122]|uniref:Uncharacterized protein n=1 Tax=Anabaena cylindrica (strain ATCC 27899 / PCC 7122) TaxID=272123 RepID=K9ZEY7_ANACC|nr:hypothetical protein Anacy_1809 [Anabaena cylindrica PCC 7122]BAY05723.1 hypothetical protein NIES19_49990 [Anabaena cylindrica PCC 7122]
MYYSGSRLSEIQEPHPQPPPPSDDASGTLREHQSPTVGNPPTALVHRKR